MAQVEKPRKRKARVRQRSAIHWMEVFVVQLDSARIYIRDNIGKALLTIFFPDDRAFELDGSEDKSPVTAFLNLVQRVYHPEWTEVPQEEAIKHPLYGVGGILGLMYLAAFVAMLGAAAAAIPAALGAIFGELNLLGQIPIIMAFALQLPFIYLTRRVDPRMPDIAIFCSWTAYPLAVVAAFISLGFWQGLGFFVGGIVTIDFFALYLRRSRRVNVTFMHRTRPEEPFSFSRKEGEVSGPEQPESAPEQKRSV